MAVIDSSALIPLIKIGRLDLLAKVFDKILIPTPVWEEVAIEGKKLGKPVKEFVDGKGKWFSIYETKHKVNFDKSIEKNDYLVFLAAKDSNDILVTNDATLYYYALSQNVKCHWLTTLILLAAKSKTISKSDAQNILLELVNSAGLHLSSEILSELLIIIKSIL